MNFHTKLAIGRTSEGVISRWMRRHGWAVLPVYEKIIEEYKGPQLFLPTKSLIAPDMLAFRNNDVRWIEAKHKTAFTWHRKTQRWVTGIDLKHYEDYLRVADASPWEVWLLFFHQGGIAKDSPPSPSGLFGNTISFLRTRENHRHSNWGSSGMVYWAKENLKELASVEEVLENAVCLSDTKRRVRG